MDNYSTCLSYNPFKNTLCVDGQEVTADEFIFYAARIANEFLQSRNGGDTPDLSEQSMRGKPRKAGVNYLMRDAATGLYKIGYTSKDPAIREATLAGVIPKISLIKAWAGTPKTEQLIHRHFESKRVRGEWFALDETDMAYFEKFQL